jgi:zinc-binding alcohol dehydrogenase family protein
MKAVGLTRYLPIDNPESLLDLDLPKPVPGPHDLLVAVKAIAVNPVDTKVRAPKEQVANPPRVLGWDAAGVVEAVGEAVTLFKPGDHVYYAGDVTRPGCNAEYQTVREEIVGRMPGSLSFAQAAALPLTTITAWEAFFDRLRVSADGKDAGKTLLIVGGAGGVGSIGIQLARQIAGLRVIATASRPESADWCKSLGAEAVVDHRGDLVAQVRALGIKHLDYIACFNDTDQHFPAMAELIRPQGTIATIVENARPLPVELLKAKSAAFAWEFMFTRAMFSTPDMIEQHRLLTRVAELVDAGTLRTTVGEVLGKINATNLKRAHALLEGGRVIGKLVLEGF